MSGRVLIAGTGSGCGKTSIACGLMMAMGDRGHRVAACKCGPDYIDPMFHREVLGAPSRNLDLFLCGEGIVRGLLAESCAADMVVIEGAMGFYDGLAGTDEASAHHLSRCTDTPVILVAGCGGKALSLAAELQGFVRFAPNRIAGFLLNRCSPGTYPMLKALVEDHTGRPVLGYLPRIPDAVLQSRHLGLVTTAEVENLREKIAVIAGQMKETVDLAAIEALARTAPSITEPLPEIQPVARVRIALARDAAFSFTYEDNLLLLEKLGAELIPFSPLTDVRLPENIQGLILSGGYPELYAGQLAGNALLLGDIAGTVRSGMPVVAECGGFLYLCKSLATADGSVYPMAGAIDTSARMTHRLSHFGYITMTARQDNLLCGEGETLRAHEFHYSEADDSGSCFHAEKQSGAAWDTVHATESLYAGYPHLHLWGNIPAARRFIQRCHSNSTSK